jgi:hypothetical protein
LSDLDQTFYMLPTALQSICFDCTKPKFNNTIKHHLISNWSIILKMFMGSFYGTYNDGAGLKLYNMFLCRLWFKKNAKFSEKLITKQALTCNLYIIQLLTSIVGSPHIIYSSSLSAGSLWFHGNCHWLQNLTHCSVTLLNVSMLLEGDKLWFCWKQVLN